jgi:lipoprotein-releasing system permease protein
MPASFSRFVALRYFRGAEGARSGSRFLRIVLYVAVGGVAVGVTALLLALAIVRGFAGEVERKIVTFGSHVQVSSLRDAPLDTTVVSRSDLASLEGVREVSQVVSAFVLLRGPDGADIEGVVAWGTDNPPALMRDALVEGTFAYAEGEQPGLIVGQGLARLMQLEVGDRVTAFAPPDGAAAFGSARARAFVVTGIYQTFLSDFDELYVFASETDARRLIGVPGGEVTRFDLTLADMEASAETARLVEDRFGFPTLAQTVYELYGNLFAWIELQQGIVPLVISILVVVAAFNLIGILFMLVLEKTREIGVLTSLGASGTQVRGVFLLLGAAVGVAGALIGVAVALTVGLLQIRFGFLPLPPEAYFLDTAPVAFRPVDFVLVPLVAVTLSIGAAYLPARRAARIDPVAALRFA